MDDLARFGRSHRTGVAVAAAILVVLIVVIMLILTGDDRAASGSTPDASVPTPAASSPLPSSSGLDPLRSPSSLPTPSPSKAPTPTAGSALAICCVVIDWITETTARITWTASDHATGQVEYGTSPAYGSTTTLEPSYQWATHIQLISGLLPGTQYHVRAHSVDRAGNEAYGDDQTFSTLAASPPPPGACFGSCLGGDTLANTTVGPSGQRVGYSFRATGSQISTIRVYWQGGSGYGGGDGGTFEASIRNDASGQPGRTVAGAATFPGGTAAGRLIMFSTPVSVTKGTLYWALFRNTSPSPSRNYTSANATLQRPTLVPRQPRQTDREYIVGYFDSSGSWTERAGYTAIIDIGYADDSHSGQGYMEFWVHPGQHAEIGGSHRVRENLSNPISRAVRTLAARIERVSGSGPLTIALYSDATLIADGTVSASVVARSPVGTDGGLTWAIVELPAPVTLPAGPATLVLTAPSGTTYSTFGIRKGGLFGYTAGATYFAYGSGQYSTDGSSSWNDFNDLANGSDVQFYLR